MTKVIFEHPDGTREVHTALAGETIMDCALDHGVVGINAQCGGACTCVTCHCYVEESWFARLKAPRGDELEMLDYVWQRRPNSRLACQIVVDDACDGIVVQIPRRQALNDPSPDPELN
jgi:2Fe-2S ferredoxin